MADQIDTLATALHRLRERLGEGLYGNRKRLVSLLSDEMPDAKVYIRSLDTAVAEGLPEALTEGDRTLVALKMDSWVDRLASNTAMREEMARSVVRAVAFSLDLGPMPSRYGPATAPVRPPPVTPPPPTPPRPPYVPPQPANSWVDMSNPIGPTVPPPYMPPPGFPPAPSVTGAAGSYPPPRRKGLTTIVAGVSLGVIALLAMVLVISSPHPDQSGPQPAPGPVPADQTAGTFGEEATDFGVPMQAMLQSNVGSPTPTTIPNGRVVTTGALKLMISEGVQNAAVAPQLIDALAGPHPSTLPGAIAMPSAGAPGSLNDGTEAQVKAQIAALPAAQAHRPLVFFCLGPRCWESYNAVLRANAAGFANLFWYRGGLQSWQLSGGALQPVTGTP